MRKTKGTDYYVASDLACFCLIWLIWEFRTVIDRWTDSLRSLLGGTVFLYIVSLLLVFALWFVLVVLLRVVRGISGKIIPCPRIWLKIGLLLLCLTPFFILALVSFTGRYNVPGSSDEGGVNLILIVVDTLRADHLTSAGYIRNTSPNMDRLAEKGLAFTDAIATAPYTTLSTASILTSLYPSSHGYGRCDRLPEQVDTVAEVLRRCGYRTGGFVGNPFLKPIFGFHQGFETYDARVGGLDKVHPLFSCLKPVSLWARYRLKKLGALTSLKRDACDINRAVLDWLREIEGEPFFLYIQYMEPHGPYSPPRPYDVSFDGGYSGVLKGKVFSPYHNTPPCRWGSISEEDLRYIISQYDGEIAYADCRIGDLIDAMGKEGMLDNSLVCVTSDHGEELMDRSRVIAHGHTLYEELVKIPLIFYGPMVPRGKSINCQVSAVDIVPTMLDAAGIEIPSECQGQSLMPLITGSSAGKETPAYSEIIKRNKLIRSIRVNGMKYVYDFLGHDEKLFNLRKDPGEEKDISAQNPKLCDELRTKLEEWVTAQEPFSGGESTVGRMDEETVRQLKALGYLD
ncbi:MAG: sulfatase [Candidatus Tritonobacter lacicola]|nr:sulfatase [Candidatus Tritonobacter lacicola]